MKKQQKLVIWSDDLYTDDEARKGAQEEARDYREDPDYEMSDAEWYDYVSDYFGDKKMNLNKVVDGVIIAFAMVGRWNGMFQGYKVLGNNIKNIFDVSEDYNIYYADNYNIRASLCHHDGTHQVLYRVAKNEEQAERIGDMIYNRQIDEVGFRKKTRSLYPYVAEIYGWKANNFKKHKKTV